MSLTAQYIIWGGCCWGILVAIEFQASLVILWLNFLSSGGVKMHHHLVNPEGYGSPRNLLIGAIIEEEEGLTLPVILGLVMNKAFSVTKMGRPGSRKRKRPSTKPVKPPLTADDVARALDISSGDLQEIAGDKSSDTDAYLAYKTSMVSGGHLFWRTRSDSHDVVVMAGFDGENCVFKVGKQLAYICLFFVRRLPPLLAILTPHYVRNQSDWNSSVAVVGS